MLLIKPQWSRRGAKLAMIWCLLMAGTRLSMAQEIPPDATAAHSLMLGVVINDHATNALAAFQLLPDGKLAATPGDLQTAGIKPATGTIGPDGLIKLDTLKGVTWQYDEPAQLIRFKAPDAARIPTTVALGSEEKPIDFSSVRSSPGFVLNYTLYGAAGWGAGSHKAFSGSFDARILTPFGVASTSALGRFDALVDKTNDLKTGLTRLDSSWRYTDPKHALVYQLGDSVSGGFSWNSSWRFGGFQFKRNFNLRPDLVTAPVPTLSGSAAVPSSLDLYLNNIKVYSGDVPAGPFDFSGLPFFSGSGDASIVMRDALGREIRSQYAYYYSSDMLAKGIFDFSTELGFPRLNYGDSSFDYDHDLAGSASARYGLTNWLTLEGHFEATRGLYNGGAGFTTSLGKLGSVSTSLSGSRFNAADISESGGRVSVNYQTGYNGYAFYAGTSRGFGAYNDIGLVVGRKHNERIPISVRATSIDTIGVSFPLRFDPSTLGINYSRVRGAGEDGNISLLSASWSRTVFEKASIFVTGYTDLDKRSNYGVFAGLSIPIGNNKNALVSADKDGIETSLTKSGILGEDPLSWSLRDRETRKGKGIRSASAKYHASVGDISGSVDQSGDDGRITATVDGALIIAGGGIFFVNQVDDAFAIVKGGGPNAPVSLNGRLITTTNSGGRAFIPDLQSYQENSLTIDPKNLPLDLQPDSTQSLVIPADRSGVVVDFGAKKLNAATVILTNPQGEPLPLGAEVKRDGTDQVAAVGYDGKVWLTDLAARNDLTITLPDGLGTCRASFTYKPVSGTLTEIAGVLCQ